MAYDPKKNIRNIKSLKVADKLSKKLEDRKIKLKLYYDALATKRKAEIENYYNKKLEKRTKSIEVFYEEKRKSKKAKIYGKAPAKNKKMWKIRLRAYTIYQKWRKLSLCDKYWRLKLADTWEAVHWSKAVAWHIYSKKNYWHMAFLDDNVWPITHSTNKEQWTSPWIYRAVNVLDNDKLSSLKIMSIDYISKNIVRDRNYYEEILSKYSKLLEIEEKRLGIYNCKKDKNEIS